MKRKFVLVLCYVLMVFTTSSFGNEIKGTVSFNSWNEVKSSSHYIQFMIESVKMGFISSKEKGFVMKYNYLGQFDPQTKMLSGMKVSFQVLDMNTDHTDRDEKLHTKTINYKISPEIIVEVAGPLKAGDAPKEVPAMMTILNKKHNFKLSMGVEEEDQSVVVIGNGAVLLSELIKLGVEDPSITIAKLSDPIELKFKVVHKL